MGLVEDFGTLVADMQALQAKLSDAEAIVAQAHEEGRLEGVQAGLAQGKDEGYAQGFADGKAAVPVVESGGFTQEQVDSAVADARLEEQAKLADAVAAAKAADEVVMNDAVTQARSEEKSFAALQVSDAVKGFKEAARAKLKNRLQSEESIAESHIDEDLDSAL